MKFNISVVVPTFNREKTIVRCLNSILAQSILPYEIIVVDDGSTDRTEEIVNKLNSSLVRIIRQNHKGAQAARNLGILNAKGEYITFLDSDDEWLPNTIEQFIRYYEKEQCADCVLYSNGYVFDEKRKTKRILKRFEHKGDFYRSALMCSGMMFQSLFVRKQILIEIGLLDEKVKAYQEWETEIRLSKVCKMIHIKQPLFIYHLHEGETISKDWKKGVQGYSYIIWKHKKEIVRECGIKGLNGHIKNIVSMIEKGIKNGSKGKRS